MTCKAYPFLLIYFFLLSANMNLPAQACLEEEGEVEDLPEIEFQDDDDDLSSCPGQAVVFILEFDDEDARHNLTYRYNGSEVTLTNVGEDASFSVTPTTVSSVLTLVSYEKIGGNCGSTINEDYAITLTPGPTITVPVQNNPSCGGSDGSVTLSAAGGNPPFTYGLEGSFQSNPVFSGLPAGNFTFTVRDANECAANTFVVLAAPEAPTLTVENRTSPNCGGSDGSVTLSAAGGTPPFTYGLEGNLQSNPVFSGLPAGNFTFTVRDANACENNVIVFLENNGDLILSVVSVVQPRCTGTDGAVNLDATGGEAPYRFRLENSEQDESTFEDLSSGIYNFSVRDNRGCTALISVELGDDNEVTGIEAMIASPVSGGAPSDQTYCAGSEIILNAVLPEGLNGRWVIEPENAGLVVDPADNNTTVLLEEDAIVFWILSSAGCPNFSRDSVRLAVTGAPTTADDRQAIDTQNSTVVDVLANDPSTGVFLNEITVAPRNGTARIEDSLIVYSPISAVAVDDSLQYEICLVACPEVCTTATVRLTDLCRSAAEGNIPPSIFPEGLILNGTGRNEALFIQIVDESVCPFVFQQSDLAVFNRWGDRIFQEAPYRNQWRGTGPNGAQLPPGTYYYVLRIGDTDRSYFSPLYIFDATER